MFYSCTQIKTNNETETFMDNNDYYMRTGIKINLAM